MGIVKKCDLVLEKCSIPDAPEWREDTRRVFVCPRGILYLGKIFQCVQSVVRI